MKLLVRMTAVFLLAAALFAPEALAREAEFDVVVRENVMVPMRDGVRLATDVYLPAKEGEAAAGKWPAILTRTPYNKSGDTCYGEYFAQRGYVFVAQDTRGRYASEGVWHMLSDDGPDGWDCAAWIEAQDWPDGYVKQRRPITGCLAFRLWRHQALENFCPLCCPSRMLNNHFYELWERPRLTMRCPFLCI